MAEVVGARGLHAARRARPARAGLRRAADHLPRFARGDVRPVRRPGAHPPLQERVRPGRVRRRLAGELTHAGLRLRRRDLLLRRRRQRPGRRAGDDRERHLHARGGLRHRLEAHGLPDRGRRGPAAAAPGDLVDRHRRQLRVRVLLVPLHRRHDRVRGQAHGRDLHRRAGAGRAACARHARRARAVRAAPSALLLRAAGHGRRRQREHRRAGGFRAAAVRAGEPDRHGLGDEADGVRGRVGARAGGPVARAVLADREPGEAERGRRSRRLQARPGGERGADVPAGVALRPAGRVHRRARVGHGVRPRASASPRATTRTSTPAGTASRATPPRVATPRARTWCSGTRSAPTTWSGPRTGR